jgi:hypothetical protein
MRICDRCGAELVKKPGPGRWPRRCATCTPKRDRSNPKHKTPAPICRHCGNPFRKAWGGRNTFCSWACACAARKGAKRPGRMRKQWPASKVFFHTCPCGVLFASRRPNQVRCSDECRKAVARAQSDAAARQRHRPRRRECRVCGSAFTPTYGDKKRSFCSDICARTHARRTRKHRHRAREAGVAYEYINPRKVFVRDGWKCGICRGKIDPRLRSPNPRSASLDHIIPIARGGPHLHTNIQAAHLICNSRKSDRAADDQLLLVS